MWFENKEENKNTKKTHGCSGEENNITVERNKHRDEKYNQSSDDESKRSDESSEDLDEESAIKVERTKQCNR